MSNPCHIELILSEKEESVKKEVIRVILCVLISRCCVLTKSDSQFVFLFVLIIVAGDPVGSQVEEINCLSFRLFSVSFFFVFLNEILFPFLHIFKTMDRVKCWSYESLIMVTRIFLSKSFYLTILLCYVSLIFSLTLLMTFNGIRLAHWKVSWEHEVFVGT